MERAAKIIAEHDDMDIVAARRIVAKGIELALSAIDGGYLEDPVDVWQDYTGLEPDYLLDILGELI